MPCCPITAWVFTLNCQCCVSSDSKDIHNVTKYLYFKWMQFFWPFSSWKIHEKKCYRSLKKTLIKIRIMLPSHAIRIIVNISFLARIRIWMPSQIITGKLRDNFDIRVSELGVSLTLNMRMGERLLLWLVLFISAFHNSYITLSCH